MLSAYSSVRIETLIDNAEATFEPVQPPLRLTGDLTTRVPVRDGLKGVRVGEASIQDRPDCRRGRPWPLLRRTVLMRS